MNSLQEAVEFLDCGFSTPTLCGVGLVLVVSNSDNNLATVGVRKRDNNLL